MTKVLSMETYRTKKFNINNQQYTIQFAVSSDELAYAMIVKNDVNKKLTKYNFTKEIAYDFGKITGEDLEKLVMDTIKSDIENGII